MLHRQIIIITYFAISCLSCRGSTPINNAESMNYIEAVETFSKGIIVIEN